MNPDLEFALSKQFKKEAMQYLHNHPEEFEQVIRLSVSDHPKLCWRAAWMIRSCISKNDARVQPHVNRILEVLPDKEDGHQRELIKILDRVNLTDDQEGILFDQCVTLWESVRKKPGTRHAAFNMMVKIAKNYPELNHEILVLAQPQFINSLSPGIKNSVRKMIVELEGYEGHIKK